MFKKICAALAVGIVALALGACTAAQLQNAQTAAQKLQSDVTLACNVIQPAIAPFAPFFLGNAPVTTFNADVVLACGSNALLNLASINDVVNSAGTVAQNAIAQIPSLTKEQVALVQGLIGAFQGSLKNAIAAYQASAGSVVATVPAAAPVAASTPLAGVVLQ